MGQLLTKTPLIGSDLTRLQQGSISHTTPGHRRNPEVTASSSQSRMKLYRAIDRSINQSIFALFHPPSIVTTAEAE